MMMEVLSSFAKGGGRGCYEWCSTLLPAGVGYATGMGRGWIFYYGEKDLSIHVK
jgi:hypothetical protein